MLDQFIQQLSKELELDEPLRSDAPGVFAMPIEDDLTIMISSLPQGFSLSCGIASCPKSNEGSFYERILLADLFGQGTKGGVLGLNEDGNLLTLVHQIEYNTDYKTFRDTLEDFINTVDFWRAEAVSWK